VITRSESNDIVRCHGRVRPVLTAVGRTMNSPLTSVDVATTGRWQQMQ
jgi:hypothetical protein